jgi:NAD+ kinase
MLFRNAGLAARYDRKKAVVLAEQLASYLESKGLEVVAEDTLVKKTGIKVKAVPLEEMKTDFVITIGGDGTILRTCISLPKPEPPILAINMGLRGFLTEVEPKDAFKAMDKCLSNQFTIQNCMKLSVKADGTNFPDVLNEVVISADEPAKILYAHIYKDKERILESEADGLMISTQTGSTAYSLSAGGPVLGQGLKAIVVTPICPLTVFHPIVFPSDTRLAIEVRKPRNISVLVDGKYRQIMHSRLPCIQVSRSKHETQFIRFRENDFYTRLRSRLVFRGEA